MAARRFLLLLFVCIASSAAALVAPASRFSRRRRAGPAPLGAGDGDAVGGLWASAKATLPPLVSGAWTDDAGDDAPLDALCNVCFIRLPIIAAACLFTASVARGDPPLVVDFGYGMPAVVPPGAVWTLFGVLLLPIL